MIMIITPVSVQGSETTLNLSAFSHIKGKELHSSFRVTEIVIKETLSILIEEQYAVTHLCYSYRPGPVEECYWWVLS